ncbi:ACP phosphodiesterase [Saccharicrinis sp. FJH2]|uniref:acyl carrier protein phosphodiesterase n=1 Tax=Saccharicrinis sp. FJH65 TaxID=3344659 RepID=UPI0035F3F1F4
MNFLAHLFLSYPNPEEMTGNFMGDFVKGRNYLNYPMEIRNGILIHRAIDHYTDQHGEAKKLITALRPIYKRYAGVVSDIVFDHILARDFNNWSELGLNNFSEYTYNILSDNRDVLPERVSFILDRIRESRRLQMYASLDGIRNSLDIMSNRTSLPDHTDELIRFIRENDTFITETFNAFFPELKRWVEIKRKELDGKDS